jgi:hypothetical protein
VLPQLGSVYYSGPPLTVVRALRMGAPMFELRFRKGYVTGSSQRAGSTAS